MTKLSKTTLVHDWRPLNDVVRDISLHINLHFITSFLRFTHQKTTAHINPLSRGYRKSRIKAYLAEGKLRGEYVVVTRKSHNSSQRYHETEFAASSSS